MPRRILGFNGLSDFFAYQQHLKEHGTVPFYLGKGFTPEEEAREVKTALHFYEGLNNSGFHPYTQRLKVVPDGRTPYYVYLDNVEWE